MTTQYDPSSATPIVDGLSHLLLQVSDLSEAEKFYCEILGLQVRIRGKFGSDRPLVSTYQGLGLTPYPVAIEELPSIEERNVEHIAFWVTDIDVLLRRLAEAGYECTEPKKNEYGRSASVRDPDNNRIELIEKD